MYQPRINMNLIFAFYQSKCVWQDPTGLTTLLNSTDPSIHTLDVREVTGFTITWTYCKGNPLTTTMPTLDLLIQKTNTFTRQIILTAA